MSDQSGKKRSSSGRGPNDELLKRKTPGDGRDTTTEYTTSATLLQNAVYIWQDLAYFFLDLAGKPGDEGVRAFHSSVDCFTCMIQLEEKVKSQVRR